MQQKRGGNGAYLWTVGLLWMALQQLEPLHKRLTAEIQPTVQARPERSAMSRLWAFCATGSDVHRRSLILAIELQATHNPPTGPPTFAKQAHQSAACNMRAMDQQTEGGHLNDSQSLHPSHQVMASVCSSS